MTKLTKNDRKIDHFSVIFSQFYDILVVYPRRWSLGLAINDPVTTQYWPKRSKYPILDEKCQKSPFLTLFVCYLALAGLNLTLLIPDFTTKYGPIRAIFVAILAAIRNLAWWASYTRWSAASTRGVSGAGQWCTHGVPTGIHGDGQV